LRRAAQVAKRDGLSSSHFENWWGDVLRRKVGKRPTLDEIIKAVETVRGERWEQFRDRTELRSRPDIASWAKKSRAWDTHVG
jgi:hypothetical protein